MKKLLDLCIIFMLFTTSLTFKSIPVSLELDNQQLYVRILSVNAPNNIALGSNVTVTVNIAYFFPKDESYFIFVGIQGFERWLVYKEDYVYGNGSKTFFLNFAPYEGTYEYSVHAYFWTGNEWILSDTRTFNVTAYGYQACKHYLTFNIQKSGQITVNDTVAWIRLGTELDFSSINWTNIWWYVPHVEAHNIRMRDIAFNGDLTINEIVRNESGTYFNFKWAPYAWQGKIQPGYMFGVETVYETSSFSTPPRDGSVYNIKLIDQYIQSVGATDENLVEPFDLWQQVNLNFILPSDAILLQASAKGLSPYYTQKDGRQIVTFTFINGILKDHAPYEISYVLAKRVEGYLSDLKATYDESTQRMFYMWTVNVESGTGKWTTKFSLYHTVSEYWKDFQSVPAKWNITTVEFMPPGYSYQWKVELYDPEGNLVDTKWGQASSYTHTNPTISVNPEKQYGIPGSTLTYTVSITNNDPVELGPSTFSLTYSVPSGWSASLSKTSVTLNPSETESSIILSITSPTTASAGEYTISVTVTNIEKSNIQASVTALYVLQKLLDMILKAHEACQALEEGILDGAEIVDKETLGVAVEALKTSIDFIPIPSGSVIVKLGGQAIKMGIKDLLNKIKDYGGNNLYSYYSNGYFSSTIESIKEEILSLNTQITRYNVEDLEKVEFLKDMMDYFDYIKLQGEYYPKNLNELVDAHKWEKFNRDLIFCGGGIFIIIITAGAATPYIVVFNGGYHAATGIYNIADESQFYEALSSTLHGFHAEALYYAGSINESLHYVTRKLDSGDFSFPKITVTPSLLGGGTIKNEYDKPVKIKVVFNVHLTSIPRDQTVAVPERHYSVCLGESIIQPQSSYIFIKPNPPQDIQEWIQKLKSFGYDVDEMVGVTIFYGEDEIYAMKGMLLPKDGSIINLEEVQHKLYLHVFDAQNRHVGMNYETKRIEIEITGAYYLENLNNITIVLPSNITDFKIIVDGKFAEEKNEAYSLTIHIINGTKIINTKQILSFLEQSTSHKYTVKILSDGTVSINLSTVFWKAEHWYMIVSIVIVTASFLVLYRRRKKIKSKKPNYKNAASLHFVNTYTCCFRECNNYTD